MYTLLVAGTPTLSTPFRQELVHADGKTERAYGDGRREVTFANGTLRLQLPDGRAVVRFTNGDVKKAFPSGARAGSRVRVRVFPTRRSGADACVSTRACRVAGRAGGPAGLCRALPRAGGRSGPALGGGQPCDPPAWRRQGPPGAAQGGIGQSTTNVAASIHHSLHY